MIVKINSLKCCVIHDGNKNNKSQDFQEIWEKNRENVSFDELVNVPFRKNNF